MKKFTDLVVIGLLLSTFIVPVITDVFCTNVWDEPNGLIGCSIK